MKEKIYKAFKDAIWEQCDFESRDKRQMVGAMVSEYMGDPVIMSAIGKLLKPHPWDGE